MIGCKILGWNLNRPLVWYAIPEMTPNTAITVAIVTLVLPLRPGLVPKIFFPKISHRIFGHMHGALNVDKRKNYSVIAQFA